MTKAPENARRFCFWGTMKKLGGRRRVFKIP